MAVQAPLVVPKRYDPMFKVDIMLHEPTLARTCTTAEIGVDIMSLCTQLDAVCKKELMMEPSHEVHDGKVPCAFMETVSIIEDRMRHVLHKDRSLPSNVNEYMEKTGMNRLFSRPAAFLKDTDNFSFKLEQTRIDEYLSSLNHLNQLMALSHQLGNDITAFPRPKYLAHQLALLYQCLHSLPDVPSLAKFKKSIQDNFKAVKTLMSDQDEQDVALPDDVRQWVLELSNQIAELVESLPAELTQPAILPAYILAQM